MAQLVAPLVSIHVVGLPDPYRIPYESASFLWFSINHLGILPVYHMIIIADLLQILAALVSPDEGFRRREAEVWINRVFLLVVLE